jgi:hypothetical protein
MALHRFLCCWPTVIKCFYFFILAFSPFDIIYIKRKEKKNDMDDTLVIPFSMAFPIDDG